MKNPFKTMIAAVAGVATAAVISAGAFASNITGAGATFPYPIYAKWADAYKKATGIGLNYRSIGSGGGIAQIKAGTVTFGATDMPLKAADLDAAGLVMSPTVIGAEVLVYHLPSVPNTLVLDGKTLSDIFLGKVTKWNDPEIKALNPKVVLPNMTIIVVHRSDGSGTTFIFANYLSKVSPEWASKVGAATAVDWPVGIGAKGNEGVAGNVQQTVGSIGYVEYAYAMQNKLSYTRLKNHDGNTVNATIDSFLASASHADWAHADHFYMILTDQPGAILGRSKILHSFCSTKTERSAASKQALDFFKWSYANGGEMAKSLLYIPLPESVIKQIEDSWKQIKGS